MSIQAEALNVEVRPSDAALGAEIVGLDLSKPLSELECQAVREALFAHCVIVFRNQTLTEQHQLDFSRRFGAPVVHRRPQAGDQLPGIFIVSNVVENGRAIGSLGHEEIGFHSDLAYLPLPGKYSILYAVEIPDTGGATSWASGYAAYDALTDDTKARLAGLRGVHRHVSEEMNPDEPTEHPLVCTHPETGRKALFLTPLFTRAISGHEREDNRQLLASLTEHVADPRFVYTHQWRVGDLVIWDNRCTMHRREPFAENARRIMKRTQIMCTERPAE